MARHLRQSTEDTVLIGPFLDATDGVTEETGLASNGTEISKAAGAYAAGPTLGTHDAEGYYPITLTTAHTDTVGPLRVKSHDSATHLPVWEDFEVIEEAVYDAIYAASADIHTGAISDIESSLVVVKSDLVEIYSDTTAIHSQTTVIESDTTVLEAGVNVTEYNGVTLGVTGQIQAVAADTPSTGITRVTIQDPGLDTDQDDQYNSGTFYLVDRSQQKVLDAGVVGDYDGTNFYVFIDDLAVTPTTAMDYLLSFAPKQSPTAGATPEVNVIEVAGTTQTAVDLGAVLSDVESSIVIIKSDLVVLDDAVSDVESSLVIVKSDLVVIESDTTAIEAAGGSLTTAQDSKLTQIHSDAIIIGSDVVQIYSDTTAIEAGGGSLTAAQASQLSQVHSDAIVLTGMVSDAESSLVIVKSDIVEIRSDTTAIETATSSAASDLAAIESELILVHSETTVIQSDATALESAVSDVESSLVVVKSDLVVITSDTTAIHSQTTVIESDTVVISSDTAAIHSQTTVVESDVALLFSAHAEPTGVPAANESPVDKLGYLFMALRNQVTVTSSKKTFFDDSGTAEWEKDLSDDGTTYTETEGSAI